MTETPRRRERINRRQYISATRYLVYTYVDKPLSVPRGDSISNPRTVTTVIHNINTVSIEGRRRHKSCHRVASVGSYQSVEGCTVIDLACHTS